MVERAICGEPMCKMQSLQLNNLKHNRNENPIPFRMPCRNCRRHKTDNKCRIRSQSTLYEAAWTPTSFVGISCPIRGFAVVRFRHEMSIASEQFSAAQTHKIWHETCWNCTKCNANSALPTLWTFMMPWGEDPGWELHSDRQRRGTNLPFGVKAVTATAAARQAAARA